MKIHLSAKEATGIIKMYFDFPAHAEIIIDQVPALEDEDSRFVEIVSRHGKHNTIPAIKEIRELTGMGLREAKDIVDRIIQKLTHG